MALTGAQKAATFMLAIGEDHAARLFAKMHEDEIRDISTAMANLGTVKADSVEELCREFAENLGQTGNLVGSWETTERMRWRPCARAGGEIMDRSAGRRADHVDKLGTRTGGARELPEGTNTRRPSRWC